MQVVVSPKNVEEVLRKMGESAKVNKKGEETLGLDGYIFRHENFLANILEYSME